MSYGQSAWISPPQRLLLALSGIYIIGRVAKQCTTANKCANHPCHCWSHFLLPFVFFVTWEFCASQPMKCSFLVIKKLYCQDWSNPSNYFINRFPLVVMNLELSLICNYKKYWKFTSYKIYIKGMSKLPLSKTQFHIFPLAYRLRMGSRHCSILSI